MALCFESYRNAITGNFSRQSIRDPFYQQSLTAASLIESSLTLIPELIHVFSTHQALQTRFH